MRYKHHLPYIMNARAIADGIRDRRLSFDPSTSISHHLRCWGAVNEFRQEHPEGVRHGVTTVYFHGRVCMRSVWEHDVQHGLEESWHSNGRLSGRTIWVNGARHGISEHWYADGQPSERTVSAARSTCRSALIAIGAAVRSTLSGTIPHQSMYPRRNVTR